MQQIDTKLPYQLIYSIGEHPYLGFLIEPHIVQLNPNGTLSLSYKRVFSNTIDQFSSALGNNDLEIIKALDQIEQTHVIKQFHKKAIRPADYFSKIFDHKIYEIIRPHLEAKLLKVLSLLQDKPLYLMNNKDGYPAERKITIAKDPVSILFHFRRNQEETRYFPTLKYQGQRMDFMFKKAEVIVNTQAWLLLEDTLYHFDQPLEGKKLTPFLQKRYISVSRSTERKYFETFVVGLIEKYHVYAEGFDIKTIRENASPILTLHYDPEGESMLQLSFRYGEHKFAAHSEQNISVQLDYNADQDLYTFTRIKRSKTWEHNIYLLLESLGLQAVNKSSGYYVTDPATHHTIFQWLGLHQEVLKNKEFVIEQQSEDKLFFIGQTSIAIEVVEDNDWFDVRAFVHFGPYKIPFIELRDHILHRKKEFRLPNGEIAIIPEEWFAQYEHLFLFALRKESLHLHKNHIGLLHEISEHTALSMSRKLQNLTKFEKIAEMEAPKHFRGTLRSYQQAGYNWFHFLQEYKFGGILADDMGLGKTIQTLALLQRLKESNSTKEYAKTSLLIMPTSLIYNWQSEAAKFAPDLKVLIHTGSNRSKDPFVFVDYDLVITTYGIARSDEDLLSKFFFNYIILDESQNIKNPTSKSFKAIKLFKSHHKLALSGTPIENSVSDIWSQMHFTNPGLLGSYSFFQKEFVVPIEKKKDEHVAQRLQAIIKPFVLRRTKSQVAKELPPKTEQIIYCEMTDGQAEYYESTKSEYRNALLEGMVQQGGQTAQIALLQGLTKLRQIANHPKMTDSTYTKGSGKFKAVLEMLSSISAEGNKVLIFSQFVKHLEIFREYFETTHIPYAYLDGSTKDRAEVVDKFKTDPEIKVFLISIKAGGVGLNLTEADYVFILDPWWNPAVEQQAIDRSHRIGQTRNVFIYKFITKDTVEEKIVALQNRKKSFADSLITTEESFMKSLSQEDIREILQ